ncbi:MAG: HlyD family type I secretion periplasmic adaptor subunit [Hyphomicrobiales bacterium]
MSRSENEWAADPNRLTSPLEIEGERWNGLFRGVATALALFFIGLIGIAAVAPINEVALTTGSIVPTQSPSTLQHDEGGVVEEIRVSVGDIVEKGDIIVQLREFQTEIQQEQLQVRTNDAMLTIARLEALINGTKPEFPRDDIALATRQELAFFEERSATRKGRAVLEARVAQREAELRSAKQQLISLREEREHYSELAEMRSQLVEEGYGTRRSLLEAKAELAGADGQISQTMGRIDGAQEALIEAQEAIGQQQAENKARWSAELSKVAAELKDFQEQSLQQKDRIYRLAIRAPFDGRVQDLLPKAKGEVIRAGEPIGQIVPSDSKLYASVRLSPKDVGAVAVNDRALVTLTAFNSDTFGEVEGLVSTISPTTATDETGNTFYEVNVALRAIEGVKTADLSQLRAGMELQARIQTEKRTMLRYFLRPVYRSLERAFSES